MPNWRSTVAADDDTDKRGVCGFVLDRVDILGLVKAMIDKGFDARLPTDKLKAVAIPVGLEPTLEVRGAPLALGIRVGDLVITDEMIWLGAHVSMAVGDQEKAIYAEPTTLTGSIGVFSIKVSVDRLLGKLGIGADSLQRGPLANTGSIYKPVTPEAQSLLEREIDGELTVAADRDPFAGRHRERPSDETGEARESHRGWRRIGR